MSAYVVNGNLIILDCNGRRLKKTKVHLAAELHPDARKNIETHLLWRDASLRWAKKYCGMVSRKNYSGWRKKAQVWEKSLRWRRNRKRPIRRGRTINGGRQRLGVTNWSQAAKLLIAQYIRIKKRNDRPWARWSETVTRNMRARNDIRIERRSQSFRTGQCDTNREVAANAGICVHIHRN